MISCSHSVFNSRGSVLNGRRGMIGSRRVLGSCSLRVLSGSSPDAFSLGTTPSASNTVTVGSGSDGIHEAKLFPLGNGSSAGNFGMLDLGAPSNATGDYITWIQHGPSKSDLAYFTSANGYPNGFQLDPVTGTLLLKGTPGVHAAMQDALTCVIGQLRIVQVTG